MKVFMVCFTFLIILEYLFMAFIIAEPNPYHWNIFYFVGGRLLVSVIVLINVIISLKCYISSITHKDNKSI